MNETSEFIKQKYANQINLIIDSVWEPLTQVKTKKV